MASREGLVQRRIVTSDTQVEFCMLYTIQCMYFLDCTMLYCCTLYFVNYTCYHESHTGCVAVMFNYNIKNYNVPIG